MGRNRVKTATYYFSTFWWTNIKRFWNLIIKNPNVEWSYYAASFLHQLGVHHACITPGARNSPLIYAFTEKSEITCFSHVDERSSAFFGLGLAKSIQNPVVLISTSGTAPANFYPAVIEASLSRVPLIILSADRPGHLIGTGANQTIDQADLYGKHICYFTDVGLPQNNFSTLQNQLEIAYHHTTGMKMKHPPGPVHLNFPFNEPLLPENINLINLPLHNPSNHRKPKLNSHFPILSEAKQPLIIVGPMEGNNNQENIIQLAKKINAPILADPISQLRYGFNSSLVLANYDLFFRFNDIKPDLVIRFSRKPTSKILCQLLDDWAKNTILIDAWEQLNDDCPVFIQSCIGNYCREQVEKITWKGSADWIKKLLSYEKVVNDAIQSEMEMHEGTIARTCFELLEDGGQFFVGNSMPVRDIDMFTSTSHKMVNIYSNRGASGIDGIISTALGMCVESEDSYSLLLIGDLSFYHDMNGLLASRYGINLTIVVINNSGGGIFSFLPIADSGINKFQKFLTTDTGLNIEKVAELYNCNYYSAQNISDLENCIQASFKKNGVKIIEVQTVISENIIAHRKFLKKVERSFSDN